MNSLGINSMLEPLQELQEAGLTRMDFREVVIDTVKSPEFEWNGVNFKGILSEVKKRLSDGDPEIKRMKGILRGVIGELVSGATPLGFEAETAFEIGMGNEEYVATDLDVLVGGNFKSGILRSALTGWLSKRPDIREKMRDDLGLGGKSRKGKATYTTWGGSTVEKTSKRAGETAIADEHARRLEVYTAQYIEKILGSSNGDDGEGLHSQTVIPDGLLYYRLKTSDVAELAGFVEVKTYSPASLKSFLEKLSVGSDVDKEDKLNLRLGLARSIKFLSLLMKFKHGGLLPKLSDDEKLDLPNDGRLPKSVYSTPEEVESRIPVFDKTNTVIVMRFPSDVESSDLKILGEYLVSLGYRKISIQKLHFTSVEIDEIARRVIARDLLHLRQKNLVNGRQFSDKEVEVLERIMRGE